MILYIDAKSGASGDMFFQAIVALGVARRSIESLLDQIHGKKPLPRQAGEIIARIHKSKLNLKLRSDLIAVWKKLAQAEGRIHGCRWQEVHFHQLAGRDTWKAFCAFALFRQKFKIGQVFVSRIPLGKGHVGHDGIPRKSPGPATQVLLKGFGVHPRPDFFEWTTPTAAALVASFASKEPAPALRIRGLGVGFGRSKYNRNPLRLLIAQALEKG